MNTNNANRVEELNSDIENIAKILKVLAEKIADHAFDADINSVGGHIRLAEYELELTKGGSLH